MDVDPLRGIRALDEELIDRNEVGRQVAFSSGALQAKVKLLMAMAIDSALGTPHGVRSLAQQALQAGATREEVAEAVRVAVYVAGGFSFYNCGRGLDGLF